MSIPFVDLKTPYALHKAEFDAAIQAVLDHGQYVMGPEIETFEQALSEYANASRTIACSSGTDALVMTLMALDLEPGDAVFTTTYSFVATAEAISLAGGTPVFVDVDPETYNIDPVALEGVIDQTLSDGKLRPRAIIPVDLFGQPADYDSINRIAAARDLFVLADAAQGFGAIYRDRKTGELADAAATSFFPAKPLGCYGDGGAILTNDEELAEILLSIRAHGQGSDRYDNVRIGLNSRMDTLQAAILLVKLKRYDEELAMRRRIADRYSELLQQHVITPKLADGLTSIWAQYSVLSDRREEIRAALSERGVPTAVYYPVPLHLSDVYRSLGYSRGDFPVAEDLSSRMFSLPMHPWLEDEQISEICSIISETCA